jgi:hypothetical protein
MNDISFADQDLLAKFEERCDALGDEATKTQQNALAAWAQDKLGAYLLGEAAECALQYSLFSTYSDLRMFGAEQGAY